MGRGLQRVAALCGGITVKQGEKTVGYRADGTRIFRPDAIRGPRTYAATKNGKEVLRQVIGEGDARDCGGHSWAEDQDWVRFREIRNSKTTEGTCTRRAFARWAEREITAGIPAQEDK
jgi:hypothetical protein